jgi:hemolysin activation/secretion protein
MRASAFFAAIFIASISVSAPLAAQDVLDRVQQDRRDQNEADAHEERQTPLVLAPTASSEASTSGSEVLIGAIVLKGLERLQPSDFAEIISSQLGRTVDNQGLRAIAAAIAQQAQSQGFVFASAWIEPQRLTSGVLTVHVDEGRIDEVRFDGPDDPAVRAALASLTSGRPAKLADVERGLLLAGDIDGVRIRNSRYFREDGRGVLLVELSKDRFAGRAALSNEGTKPLGPIQARIEADLNGLLANDDSLTFSYTGTPANPRELHFGNIRYAKRVSTGGTEFALSASASRARPGAYLRDLELRSRSWYAGLSVLQPLSRRRRASLWFEGELGLRSLIQGREGERVREDRLAVARATLYGYADLAGGRLRSSVTLSRGLDIFGATEPGDPLASRFDADGTFTTLNVWSDWTRSLNKAFSLRLAAQGQLSSDPLLITEEVSLGGTGFLRGYDWSERSGDEGLMGSAELRYDWQKPFGRLPNAQVYGFVDGGELSNIHSDFGSGSLASGGGGIRLDLGDSLGAAFEVAVPLTGPRYDTGDKTPKINLRVAKAF